MYKDQNLGIPLTTYQVSILITQKIKMDWFYYRINLGRKIN